MEYIRLYDKIEDLFWYGKWNEKINAYESHNPTHWYDGNTNQFGTHLYPTQTMRTSFEELQESNDYRVTVITAELYWEQANTRLAQSFDKEIEELEQKISKLRIDKEEALLLSKRILGGN